MSKVSRHMRHGTLHPLALSYSPCDLISMDFITHLPVSEDCSTVCVIVDRYNKMDHFVPAKNTLKTSKGYANRFLANVWKLSGLPSDTVLD